MAHSPQKRTDNIVSIAVSQGEPAGIGPDVILNAWAQRKAFDLPHFTVIGDSLFLADRARQLGFNIDICAVSDGQSARQINHELPVIELENLMSCAPGKPEPKNCAGVIESIERGVGLVLSGEFSALTTAPINKNDLYKSGFKFPGHTEFLAELSTSHSTSPVRAIMMLAGPQLRTIPITIHIAINEIPKFLSPELIIETAKIADRELRERFGIAKPVLAFAGLNPHAGEQGSMGREEIELIEPAIEKLRADGICAIGPLPADTMFHKRARETYDVALCMYHDQALIPAKTLAFDDGVNVTLGLPFIRTSPDHGTAYDLAGTSKARPDSFIAALKMAAKMATNSTQKTDNSKKSPV